MVLGCWFLCIIGSIWWLGVWLICVSLCWIWVKLGILFFFRVGIFLCNFIGEQCLVLIIWMCLIVVLVICRQIILLFICCFGSLMQIDWQFFFWQVVCSVLCVFSMLFRLCCGLRKGYIVVSMVWLFSMVLLCIMYLLMFIRCWVLVFVVVGGVLLVSEVYDNVIVR